MKIDEVENLLLFASGLDHFVTVDKVTADAWFFVLSGYEITLEQAMQACTDHYMGPDGGRQFTVRHVVASAEIANRSSRKLIETDVRSARARKIVDADWPESEPLTPILAARLAAARDKDRVTAEVFALGIPDGVAGDFGVVLKEIP